MSLTKLSISAIAILAASSFAASARDQLQIAGSSTVLPYATIVAEAFGEQGEFKTPVVEGGGSGAGRKKLCEGVGEETIDIANSSSRIKQSDIDTCNANGVTEILEVRFGYDGIVFASDINGADFALTPADVWGAMAAQTVKDGALAANGAKTWADVNAALPAQEIMAFIPGTKQARGKCSTSRFWKRAARKPAPTICTLPPRPERTTQPRPRTHLPAVWH